MDKAYRLLWSKFLSIIIHCVINSRVSSGDNRFLDYLLPLHSDVHRSETKEPNSLKPAKEGIPSRRSRVLLCDYDLANL